MKVSELLKESITVAMKNDKWRDSYKHASRALKAKGYSVQIKDAGSTLVVTGEGSVSDVKSILASDEDIGTTSVSGDL